MDGRMDGRVDGRMDGWINLTFQIRLPSLEETGRGQVQLHAFQ